MTSKDANAIRYVISVRISPQLKECIEALSENHCKPAGEVPDAILEWAEINYVPSDGNTSKVLAMLRRYLAIRIKPRQGGLLACGASVRHFTIVTKRNDTKGGTGLDLISWQRQKTGTIEHIHDVLMNELAGWCLPSQKFGTNAAWLRLNVLLYNLLSAFKRVSLPEETHDAPPDAAAVFGAQHGRQGRAPRPRVPARLLPSRCQGPVDEPRVAFRLLRPALAVE
jgi:hypothetical protein